MPIIGSAQLVNVNGSGGAGVSGNPVGPVETGVFEADAFQEDAFQISAITAGITGWSGAIVVKDEVGAPSYPQPGTGLWGASEAISILTGCISIEGFSVGGPAVLTISLPRRPRPGQLLIAMAGAAHTGGSGVGDYYTWDPGWVTIAEGFHPSWAASGSNTLGLFSFAYRIADGTETSVTSTAHVANFQSSHMLVMNYGVKPVGPGLLAGAWSFPGTGYSSGWNTQSAPLPSVAAAGSDVLLIGAIQHRPNYAMALPADYTLRGEGTEFDIAYSIIDRTVHIPGGASPYGGTLSTPSSPGTGVYPDPLWTLAHAAFAIPANWSPC